MTEILKGSSKVRVETESEAYDINRDSEDSDVLVPEIDLPDTVKDLLRNQGFELKDVYPKEISRYFHDSESRCDARDVSEELGLPEDHDTVQRIAGYGYEIQIDFVVESRDTVYVTALNNHELEERIRL